MSEVKTFVVLGMHKSATSLAAKGLHEAGVYMGENLNRYGFDGYDFYENEDFVNLNDRILKAAGGDHKNPPSRQRILEQDFSREIQEVISKHERKLWGWKDPRTTLTIELYMPYLKNPHFITCFRDPKKVARHYHGDVTLAYEYNRRLLDFLYKNYVEYERW